MRREERLINWTVFFVSKFACQYKSWTLEVNRFHDRARNFGDDSSDESVGDERFIGMDERFLGGPRENNRCLLDINPSLNFSISIISIEDAYLLERLTFLFCRRLKFYLSLCIFPCYCLSEENRNMMMRILKESYMGC